MQTILYKISFIQDSLWGHGENTNLQQFVGTQAQANIWIKTNALERFNADVAKTMYTAVTNTLEGANLRGTLIEADLDDEYWMVEEIIVDTAALLRDIFTGQNDDLEKMYRQILADVGECYGSQNDVVIHEVMNTLIASLEKGKYVKRH